MVKARDTWLGVFSTMIVCETINLGKLTKKIHTFRKTKTKLVWNTLIFIGPDMMEESAM